MSPAFYEIFGKNLFRTEVPGHFQPELLFPASKIPDDWSKNKVFGFSKIPDFCLTTTPRGYNQYYSD
jgi:hypothetical protein